MELIEYGQENILSAKTEFPWQTGGEGRIYMYNIRVHEKDPKSPGQKRAAILRILKEEDREKLMRECKIATKLLHANIVRFYGTFRSPDGEGLLFEYCEGGSLQVFCEKLGYRISLRILIFWFSQIASGMKYISSEGVYHRDLKPLNIFVKGESRKLSKLVMKIGDFGLTRTGASANYTRIGSDSYMPPEIAQQTGEWNPKSDVYSFGATMLKVVTSNSPPENPREDIIIEDSSFNGRSDLKHCVEKCLKLNPKERPSFEELVDSLNEMRNPEVFSIEEGEQRHLIDPSKCIERVDWRQQHILEKNKPWLIASAIIFPLIIIISAALVLTKPLLFPEPIPLCSGGYSYGPTGYCYKLYSHLKVYDDAESFCKSEGGHLASINSDSEEAMIQKMILENKDGEQFWIGVAVKNRERVWADRSIMNVSFWGNFIYPYVHEHRNYMIEVDGYQYTTANVLRGFICKRPGYHNDKSKKMCDEGYTWFEHTKSCYKIGFYPLSFEKATKVCAENNAYLASINSDYEYLQIRNFYQRLYETTFALDQILLRWNSLWIGLVFDWPSRSWQWVDGAPVNRTFLSVEEQDPSQKLFWMMIDTSDVYLGHEDNKVHSRVEWRYWEYTGVNNYLNYICKKPDKLSPVAHPPNITTKPEPVHIESGLSFGKCSEGYTLFPSKGYCYKISDTQKTCSEAEKECLADGAHLASIHSFDENSFITELLKNKDDATKYESAAIGLQQNGRQWEWTDGSSVVYTYWADIEPNFMKSEPCTALVLKGYPNPLRPVWNNVDNVKSIAFVCKKMATE